VNTWPQVRLGEVTESMKNGIYKPASAYADDGYACLRMYNIDDGKLVWRDIKRMRLSRDELSEYRLLPGDLLVNRVNSRELVGKAAVIPVGLEPLVFESKNIRLRLLRDRADPKFINYQLLLNGRRHFAVNAQQVVGMASVNQKQLADFSIVLPPLDIQREAVAEIEKQFSRLDEAAASLKRTKANLKRYRAAVLKAAVEGKMLQTRKANEGDGSLPTGWKQETVKDSLQIIDYRGRTPPFSASGIPHLRSSNIRDGQIVWSNLAYVTEETYREYMTRGIPKEGDVLFTTEAPMGEAALVPRQKFSLAQRIMVLRPNPEFLTSHFLMIQLMSHQFQAKLSHRGTGSTVTGVSSRNFQPLSLVIPPLDEQQEIAAEVERRLSVIKELDASVEANLTRAERLRQATLQYAFSGRLL